MTLQVTLSSCNAIRTDRLTSPSLNASNPHKQLGSYTGPSLAIEVNTTVFINVSREKSPWTIQSVLRQMSRRTSLPWCRSEQLQQLCVRIYADLAVHIRTQYIQCSTITDQSDIVSLIKCCPLHLALTTTKI